MSLTIKSPTQLFSRPSNSRPRSPFNKPLTTCSLETQHLFIKRLRQKGWPDDRLPLAKQPPLVGETWTSHAAHQLVAETWKAMDTIYAAVLETPLHPSPWLKEAAQDAPASVHLKMEVLQNTGSFKARGACAKIFSLTEEELQRGIHTSSTGNHALAVLHACQQLTKAGKMVQATVHVPDTLAPSKAEKLAQAAAASGAVVVKHGKDCVEAEYAARQAAQASGGIYISPYNDATVAGGQGTIAVELLMQLDRDHMDVVFVPVGGGGLVSGIAALLKSVDRSIKVIGCQPARSDVMRRSVAEGRVVTDVEWETTLSDATAGGIEENALTLEPCRQFVDEWVVVSEEEIAAAMIGTSKHHGVAVEGAAGVAIAGFLKKASDLKGKHAVIVFCGANISTSEFERAFKIAAHTA